jgi:hypothetical protein
MPRQRIDSGITTQFLGKGKDATCGDKDVLQRVCKIVSLRL